MLRYRCHGKDQSLRTANLSSPGYTGRIAACRTDLNRTRILRTETNWKRWGVVAAAILILIVVLQNSQEVDFNLLFVNTSAPLILLLLVFTLLGAAIGYLVPIVRRGRKDPEGLSALSLPASGRLHCRPPVAGATLDRLGVRVDQHDSAGPASPQLRPSVPLPQKKSRHQSPGRVEAATIRRRMPSGFWLG